MDYRIVPACRSVFPALADLFAYESNMGRRFSKNRVPYLQRFKALCSFARCLFLSFDHDFDQESKN